MRPFRIDRYTLAGIGAILIWSTWIALVRSISEQVGPLTAAAAVHLVAGAFCLGHSLFSSRGPLNSHPPLPSRYLIGCGALFVLYMLASYLAIGHAADRRQVLEIGLLNYLWPALTIWFSLFLLGRKAGLILGPGTLLALAGIFLVLTQGHEISSTLTLANVAGNPIAYFLGLTAAISWALYSNLARRWAGGPESSGGVVFFLPATGIILLILRLLTPEDGSWNLRAGLEVVFMGLVTALGYALWDMAMRKGDILLVACCSYFTPLLSTLLSCIYLQVRAGFNLWLGCLFIVAGSLISWAAVSDKETKTKAVQEEGNGTGLGDGQPRV